MSRRGYFAGTFNPFTRGHADIVNRALDVADELIIGIGCNINKPGAHESAESRKDIISTLYAADDRVKVEVYQGLTGEEALRRGCSFLIRGVRDTRDFEYERQIAEVNRRLFGIETILLFADPGLASLSSSMVRELKSYGVDVTAFLPE